MIKQKYVHILSHLLSVIVSMSTSCLQQVDQSGSSLHIDRKIAFYLVEIANSHLPIRIRNYPQATGGQAKQPLPAPVFLK